jgi:multimeric flavodoxin WrbA
MTVLGSPRRNGNTAKVLAWTEDELRKLGHTIERVYVGDGSIAPCRGCNGCKKTPDKPGCTATDRGNDIFSQMLLCDVVLFASPLYCWGLAAQLKCLIDRAYCLLKEDPKQQSLLAGQRMALLVTGGGEIEDNLSLTVPPFREFAEYFQCENAGALLIPDCTEPAKIGAAVEKQAREFAKALVKSGEK